MSESDAFLRAIAENPDDDQPRLIYADWLDDHGEAERAEFIRVQIRVAREMPDPRKHIELRPSDWKWIRIDDCGKCTHCLLRRRERELLDACPGSGEPGVFAFSNNVQWSGLDLATWAACKPVWRRGFVAEVTLTCADWLQHRESLLRAALLEKVTLTHLPEGIAGQNGTVVLVCNQTFVYANPETGKIVDLSFAVSLESVYEAMQKAMIARMDWEFLRNANASAILHGDPDAQPPQGTIHRPRR